MLLPSSILTLSAVAYGQEADAVDALPLLDANESDIGLQPQYTPLFNPIPEPEVVTVDASAEVAAASVEIVVEDDTEASKIGVVAGEATVALPVDGSLVQAGNLPLLLRWQGVAGSEITQPLVVQTTVMPVEKAKGFTLTGLAFTIKSDALSAASSLPLQLTVDYSQIPMNYGGSYKDRLTLIKLSTVWMAQELSVKMAWSVNVGTGNRWKDKIIFSSNS